MRDNPFKGIPAKSTNPVRRKPFNPEELNRIVAAAAEDELLHGPVIASICTALRKADACCLTWEDVDFDENLVRVRTSKTSKRVMIPLLPLLRELLLKTPRKDRKGFCFPEAADMQRINPCGIDYRLRKLLTRAGVEDLREGREDGRRAASVKGFHAFRVTWVTLALSAGVPVELVRKVTGHTTADIVLEHYYQPGRKDFIESIGKAMPELLMKNAPRLQKQGADLNRLREIVKTSVRVKGLREEALSIIDEIMTIKMGV